MTKERWYPSEDVWPETEREAHKFLVRAYWHLKNAEKVEFESLDARAILNQAQINACGLEVLNVG